MFVSIHPLAWPGERDSEEWAFTACVCCGAGAAMVAVVYSPDPIMKGKLVTEASYALCDDCATRLPDELRALIPRA